ncbi:DUF6234 family protein [Nonomuraea sediminis]|uniref:DUF6234 family protein n=1 Tax=Nonomuraea sediminis TaxID=2835864 RepID=UPI001BDBD92A|nr:DUF6234 family protein [Nonomuraea sediminis]
MGTVVGDRRRAWGDGILVILTFAWPLASVWLIQALIAQGLGAALGGPVDERQTAAYVRTLAIVVVAGPALATLTAIIIRRRVAVWIYGLIATCSILAVLTLVSMDAYYANRHRPPEPLPSGYCAAYSGGTNHCPGG